MNGDFTLNLKLGTTGIRGLDLLGRKIIMKNGKACNLYLEEVQRAIREARKFEELGSYVQRLKESFELLRKVTCPPKTGPGDELE